MTEETAERVRRLLLPRDDESQWQKEVEALNKWDAVPLLAAIMNDPAEKRVARQRASEVLGMLKDARAVGALVQALQAPDPVLRAVSAKALGSIGNLEAEVIQQLIQRLGDEDYYVRESAAKALGQLKRAEAIPALKQMNANDIVSTNRSVAQQAIESIEKTA